MKERIDEEITKLSEMLDPRAIQDTYKVFRKIQLILMLMSDYKAEEKLKNELK